MTLTAAPGIIIVEPIESKQDIVITGVQKGKVMLGKVIAVGADLTTNHQTYKMQDYAAIGDTISFMTYEGEYDKGIIDGKEYHFVKIEDVKGKYE